MGQRMGNGLADGVKKIITNSENDTNKTNTPRVKFM